MLAACSTTSRPRKTSPSASGRVLPCSARQDGGQLLHVLADQLLQLQEDARAGADGGLLPGLEGFLGAAHRGVDFLGRGKGHAGQHFLGGRVDHVAPLGGFGFDQLAVDQQLDGGRKHLGGSGGVHGVSPWLVGVVWGGFGSTDAGIVDVQICLGNTRLRTLALQKSTGTLRAMDWDHLRLRHWHKRATLAGAARVLGVEHTTVARRIQALEQQLGHPVFLREASGHKLNEAGRQLLPVAQAMEQAARGMEHLGQQAAAPPSASRLAWCEWG